ncbi:MAG: 2-dehydro-3-deoxyphosphogluconate aldolase, partial [Actinobacteria bacterium]|nr:2-dehydro-3-deoxyphosphogluconate aldolase [Actinomycetota bacterium]
MKTIDALLKHKIMGLVRTNDQVTGQGMADAMVKAGIRAIEITLTTPGALSIVEKLSANKDLTVGVGTVISKKDVKSAAKAGAKFIVSPNTDLDVIK